MAHSQSWQIELDNFIGIKSLFSLEGNIDDIYPIGGTAVSSGDGSLAGNPIAFETLETVLRQLFERRGYHLIVCDPLRGIAGQDSQPLVQEAALLARQRYAQVRASNPVMDVATQEDSAPFLMNRLVENAMVIRAALTTRLEAAEGRPVACMVNLANRLTSNPSDLTPEENAVYLNLLLAVQDAIRPDGSSINTLITIADRTSSLPAWFYQNNPGQRTITVPMPDRTTRALFVDYAFEPSAADGASDDAAPAPSAPGTPEEPAAVPEGEATPDDPAAPAPSTAHITAKAREKFIDTTDSMKLLELDEIRRLFLADHIRKPNEDPSDFLVSLVELYKYGIRENRWMDVAEKLKEDPLALLQKRVMGQDAALERIVAVLKRSVLGLSGLQHSSQGKPKGVLFLAGPTGTGKTEVVKAVTELLFGDERSYQRFDMSEYASENADQKLFGAPPGYVGYDQGGQLTNAVRENPFTVLLFDEIEKAHPSIMDKFLQILEDGRMTDGQGNTVYFGETLIFFTSNAGVSEEIYDATGHVIGRRAIIEPGEPYPDMERKVIEALSIHFKPEVMGRIGNNVIVFDFISEDAARSIMRAQIERINKGIRTKFNTTIRLTDAALEHLFTQACSLPALSKGGRGIGNLVESSYLNPLSSFLFDQAMGLTMGCTTVVEVSVHDGALAFTTVPASTATAVPESPATPEPAPTPEPPSAPAAPVAPGTPPTPPMPPAPLTPEGV